MIILFAAGNEGQGLFGGSTKYNSIGSPGTAKNCITVGASENYRPEKVLMLIILKISQHFQVVELVKMEE